MRRLVGHLIAIVVLLVLAIIFINSALTVNDMASCDEVASSGMCRAADVIVAVSGGDTASRARKAIEMYQAGWADKIIFSGDSADPDAISNAAAMKQIAIADGVPSGDIYLDENSKDTKENATNTVQILHNIGATDVILVSSPYHLQRVKMNFAAVDNTISYRTVAANDAVWNTWFLKPDGWTIAIKELAGIAELSAQSSK